MLIKVRALFLVLAFITSFSLAAPAFALTLDEAKSAGLVGEQPDGYLGVVQASTEVNALVADINSKRREKYKNVAAKSGTSLRNVEVLAGEKAINNTPQGQYIRMPNGEWVVR